MNIQIAADNSMKYKSWWYHTHSANRSNWSGYMFTLESTGLSLSIQ